jgi:hypothetical protein
MQITKLQASAIAAPAMMSVRDFCKSHGISRSFFYKLESEGKGPRCCKCGARTLISAEAAEQMAARAGTGGGMSAPKVVPLVGRGTFATDVAGKHFKILTHDQLLLEPAPVWLIEGLVPQDSLALLFGEPETFKSFFTIGLACSVATGKLFLDAYEVKQTGDVVYIYGEGARGIGRRVRAWDVRNKCTAERFFSIGEPVNMLHDDPDRVIADIKAPGGGAGVDRAGHHVAPFRRWE